MLVIMLDARRNITSLPTALSDGGMLLHSIRACSSIWLEPTAHNGLVASSSLAGPTILLHCVNLTFW